MNGDIQADSMERALLGAILIGGRGCLSGKVLQIRPASFDLHRHRLIWQVIVDLFSKGDPIDIELVGHYLEDESHLGEIGGVAYLTELINGCPTMVNIVAYADAIL